MTNAYIDRRIVCIFFLCGYAAAQTPVWTHNPALQNGPLNWGAVAPPYATCGAKPGASVVEVGMKQTPINIDSAKTVLAALPSLGFRYRENPLEVENTGHVIEVVYEPGSVLRIGRDLTDEYQLLQFHFHAPSEHTVDGKLYDAELHLVHSNVIGELAVVGVLLSKSDTVTPGIFDDIIAHAPAETGSDGAEGATLNARELLPVDRGYYHYTGSLTTPPCSEGLKWFVLTQPVPVTNFVIQQLHSLIGHFPDYNGFQNNNRPVVPLNGRTVLRSH